jgi:NADPH:quinone reductase-like Zn-dependent oxidoreductase
MPTRPSYRLTASSSVRPASRRSRRRRYGWPTTTARGALIDIGRFGRGDAVIIPAASSSVGLAAIQTANSIGPIPIATTRTRAKAAALDAAGAAHVVVTSEQDLLTEVSHATGGKGARLVFGPVGNPPIETLAKAMSHCGILLIYGAFATAPAPFPIITAMQKALALHGYTLFAFMRDPERLARAAAFIEDEIADGSLEPIIAKTLLRDAIVQAHVFMESNEQFGRLVVTVPHRDRGPEWTRPMRTGAPGMTLAVRRRSYLRLY